MTRAGLLGGTFDPPHLAHLVLAAAAWRTLALDRVVLMPAGEPWRKAAREVMPAAIRLELVRAAVEGVLPWAEVSDLEARRSGPTFTVETLEALHADDRDVEWWFILGRDALADLPNWHEPARLLELTRLALAQRGPEEEPLPALTVEAYPDLSSRVDLVAMPRLDVSASELRRRVASGERTDPWLPVAVRRHIDELGLYRD